MPIFLVTFLASILGELVKFFTKFVGKKVAIGLGFTAFFLATLAVLVSFLYGLLLTIQVAAPPTLAQAASMVVPYNAPACVAAAISAKIAAYVWDFTMRKMNLLFVGSW